MLKILSVDVTLLHSFFNVRYYQNVFHQREKIGELMISLQM